MIFRRVRFSVVAVVLSALFIASGVVQPVGKSAAPAREGATVSAANAKASPAVRAANWTFWGCWTQFSAGTCRDIFRDQQGNYWICRACGTTGNPGSGKCSQISQQRARIQRWFNSS
jgi:hypothetical protein